VLVSVIACDQTKAAIAEQRKFSALLKTCPYWPDMNSAFTRVAACTLALSPIGDPHSEGFSQFVTS
jgi:hypothetical protein